MKTIISALSLKCPQCKKSSLYDKFFRLKNKCDSCGYNLKDIDVGDGPAYAGIFFVSFLIPILAIILEIYYEPSIWVHVVLWFPLIIIFSIFTIAISKSIFIWVDYRVR
jgi:uncharacterized protein (DUF983 family)